MRGASLRLDFLDQGQRGEISQNKNEMEKKLNSTKIDTYVCTQNKFAKKRLKASLSPS